MAAIVDQAKCVGHKACVEVCPVDAIEIMYTQEGAEVAIINDKCIDCGACVAVCPTEAITMD